MTFRLKAAAAVLTVSVLALTAFVVARPPSAEAHPLGNFTVNRYSRIELYSDTVRVRYVLDMAEIPTFQEMETIDLNGDGEPSAQENQAYLATKATDIVGNLSLSVNGSSTPLQVLT